MLLSAQAAPKELRPGDQLRFGASTRSYVYSYLGPEEEEQEEQEEEEERGGTGSEPAAAAAVVVPQPALTGPVEGRILGKRWQPPGSQVCCSIPLDSVHACSD